MNTVDPRPVHVGQDFKVRIGRQKLRLEAAHLAGRSSQAVETLTIGDGAHDRIVREALGVIHVLVSGKPTKHRLPKKSHEEMSDVLAAPPLRQNLSAQLGQSKRVIEPQHRHKVLIFIPESAPKVSETTIYLGNPGSIV